MMIQNDQNKLFNYMVKDFIDTNFICSAIEIYKNSKIRVVLAKIKEPKICIRKVLFLL